MGSVERRRRLTSIRIQDVLSVTDPAAGYSGMSARLRSADKILHHMIRGLNSV